MTTKVRVLIVADGASDDESVRRQLTEATPMQYVVDTAVGLDAAVEALRNGTYDVMLLDLNLPESRGLATLDAVRRENGDLPIVVISGLNDVDPALRSLEHGAQDYLFKGRVDAETLNNSIRFAMQRQQRLHELTCAKQQLEKKNRRLTELYETAYRFVDDVSHEFRTPLTVIKEYASLIRDGLAESVEMRNRFLDIVKDRADDLNTMVDDMLDVSKLDAGLLGIWRKNCRIDDIVADLRPSLERKAVVRGVTLDVEVEPALPEVYCDPEKIGRVLINLTVNAIKFCRQGGNVRIWAMQNPRASGVVVGVTDDGPGIDRGNFPKIFERFQRLERNARESGTGFGLGLSIAKELVDLNYGELNVESEPGRGSTFSFGLPPADPVEVMRRFLQRFVALFPDRRRLSLVAAVVDEMAAETEADEIGAFFYGALRRHDLTFRLDDRTWLIVLDADEQELAAFHGRVNKMLKDVNRNRIHGPLPSVELRTCGTWSIQSASHDWFVQALQRLSTRSLVDA